MVRMLVLNLAQFDPVFIQLLIHQNQTTTVVKSVPVDGRAPQVVCKRSVHLAHLIPIQMKHSQLLQPQPPLLFGRIDSFVRKTCFNSASLQPASSQ